MVILKNRLLRNFTEMLKLVYLEKASICLIVLFFILACAALIGFVVSLIQFDLEQ